MYGGSPEPLLRGACLEIRHEIGIVLDVRISDLPRDVSDFLMPFSLFAMNSIRKISKAKQL